MAEWITETLADDWVCVCGNTPDMDGFWPYMDGREVDASDPGWNGHDVACRSCRRVVDGWQAQDAPDGSIRLPVIDRPARITWLDD